MKVERNDDGDRDTGEVVESSHEGDAPPPQRITRFIPTEVRPSLLLCHLLETRAGYKQ